MSWVEFKYHIMLYKSSNSSMKRSMYLQYTNGNSLYIDHVFIIFTFSWFVNPFKDVTTVYVSLSYLTLTFTHTVSLCLMPREVAVKVIFKRHVTFKCCEFDTPPKKKQTTFVYLVGLTRPWFLLNKSTAIITNISMQEPPCSANENFFKLCSPG